MKQINLYQKIYELVKQIPRGKVSTYKHIAIALGDPIAARAVGQVLNVNDDPETIPCYRVVHSNGEVGGYSLGKEEKIRRLKSDGLKIISGKIANLDKVLFTDFKTDFPLMKLKKEQEKLREKVKIVKPKLPRNLRVAGVDVSYKERKAKAAIVVMDSNLNILKEKSLVCNVNFPYIPTYLSYREAPIILKLVKTIGRKGNNKKVERRKLGKGEINSMKIDKMETEETSIVDLPAIESFPNDFDLLLIDGNGILHPRRFGLASHVGVLLNKPTIGVAKSLLMGKVKNGFVYDGSEIVGAELRLNGKPIYVSPGHLIDLKTSIEIVRKFTKRGLPELLKRAHRLARF